jgi:hypothetical protein
LTYSIPTPTTTSTPTPNTSSCSVSFDLNTDQAICWRNPIGQVKAYYTIKSLPSSGGPFHLQTNWYVAAPQSGPMHYLSVTPITNGQKGYVTFDWPGIQNGLTTEIHVGLNVMDANNKPVYPDCTGGIDYYWTPYVACPTP